MNTVNDSCIIRRLQANESLEYRAIRLESLRLYPALFGTTYAEATATPSLPFEHFIQTQDNDSFMFGAFAQDQLCGICGFQREKRQRTRHRGELIQMYVEPSMARHGIGGRLINTVLNYVFQDSTLKQVVLGVLADNTAAVSLYKRAGFREYGRLENYFSYNSTSSTQIFMVCERLS
jgi:RimJ/RimL family protein N-acetyltransferase